CAWCDSAFTWDGTGKDDIQMMDAEQIWAELKELGGDGFSFVTISGGNPALLKNLDELIKLLKKENIQICLETQGSKWQDWFLDIDELTISPKPPSSRMETNFEILDGIVMNLIDHNFSNNVSLKVVVFDESDYQYAKHIHQRYSSLPFFVQVGNDDLTSDDNQQFLMRSLQKYSDLIDKVMLDHELKNVKVLPQLHTFLWGNKRGV
ncbi:MAG: 7-carboxy-7-deazaguanine synthase QueE, partial [Bacillota bacterium]|nr:7-carboxy-7-deazaguanine synthase QueE [Bacillota bacterium]